MTVQCQEFYIPIKQACHFMGALAKTGPERGSVIVNPARSFVCAILPFKE